MNGTSRTRRLSSAIARTLVLALAALVASSTAVSQSSTAYVDATPTPSAQAALEASFLAAIGTPVSVGFDDIQVLGCSTQSVCNGVPVSGTEWLNCGVTITPPPGGGLVLRTADSLQTPHTINGLWPTGGESFTLDLVTPCSAVGLFILDSEAQQPGPYPDSVDFYDAANTLIRSIPMPSWAPSSSACSTWSIQANFFIGLVSSIPICKVVINESPGETNCIEGVGMDTLYAAPIAVRPGSGDPLVLASTISGPVLSCPSHDTKTVLPGGTLSLSVMASGFTGAPLLVFAEAHPGAAPITQVAPSWSLSLAPPFLLNPATPMVPPSGSWSLSVAYPGGAAGASLLVQALVLSPLSLNGFYATSDAHEFRL